MLHSPYGKCNRNYLLPWTWDCVSVALAVSCPANPENT